MPPAVPQPEMSTAGLSERITALRADFRSAAPEVCIARARAVISAFTENRGAPAVIKKGRAFYEICKTIPVKIYDHELIVGASGAFRRSAGVSPEVSWQWIEEEMSSLSTRTQDPYRLDPDTRRELTEEILPQWQGKSVEDAFLARIPEETAKIAVDTGIIDNDSKWRCAVGEVTPDFQDILFVKGIKGCMEEARQRRDALDMSLPEDIGKAQFYTAVIDCAKGLICLARRYENAARTMANTLEEGQRKTELETIAANLRQVPKNPPQTFWQAIQMVWLIQLGNTLFENAVALNLGRFDQYMAPFYEQDLAKGTITQDFAQELVSCLWIKLSEWVWFVSKNTASYFAGYSAFQNLTVGGKKIDGSDGTNPVSYMCLAAAEQARTHQPNLSVRIHPDSPHKFVLAVCDLVKQGLGFPAIHNDRVGTQMLTCQGLPHAQALDWSNCGCVVPHSRKVSEWTSACNINLTAALEFTLTGGRHRLSGTQMSIDTGDLSSVTDFNTFKARYFTHLAYMIRHGVIATLVAQEAQAELAPRPLFSLFTEGCMESGKDISRGGARHMVGPVLTGIGIADAANGLAAVNHLVFDKKITDFSTLDQALEKDWEGYEDLHTHALSCPKFGNDLDEVDRFAVEISDFYEAQISQYKDIYGNRFNSAFMGISNYIPAGKVIGATPCGRRASEPLTEGCSPHAGTDVTSPTAAMRSTAKINHGRHTGGTLLNIKLSPDTLKTRSDLNKLAGLIRGYFELDAFHVQFNVFDKEVLLDAQVHPESHQDLLVRVAGYSARFVTLSKEVQDAIIRRTSYTGI